jgi:hypothetical protein
MAAIELSVLARQCLDRRIPDAATIRIDSFPASDPPFWWAGCGIR